MATQPAPSMAADICILTKHGIRKSRLFYVFDPMVPANEQSLEECCIHIFDYFAPKIAELLPTPHRVQKVEGTYFGPGGTGFVANSTNAPVDGELTSPSGLTGDETISGGSEDILPDEAALIIQRKTGKRGRENYGRIFIAGLSERIQFAGEITPAFHGAVKNLAEAIPGDITVSGESITTVLHARHWNRKDNTLMPVTKAYAVGTVGTRKDRRRPLRLERL